MGQMGEDIADWKYFLSIISKCTDDYLYIYDLSDDYAIYSSSITKDFELDVAEFSNAGRKLKDVIYPDDYEAVFNNISELQNGHISCHNMEYRWKSRKNGYVFISCRGQLVRRNGINYMIGRVSEIGKKNRYDNVTGIYTDLILEDRYDDIVKSDGHTGCIMQIGIDNFKEINEKYGTKTGDEVLAILACKLFFSKSSLLSCENIICKIWIFKKKIQFCSAFIEKHSLNLFDVMNEAQLIIELKMGSTHALEKIYDLYSARLYAFGLHYSKSREATQELVEDVFIWLWMNRKSIRQKESLRSILFIRLRHYLINAYRATVNSPQFRNYLDYLAGVPTEAADSAIEYDEFVKRLNLAISQLPITQQKVVRLIKFEALNVEEVARQLNITEQTVRNQLYLGLKQLRQALGVYYILLEFLLFVNT